MKACPYCASEMTVEVGTVSEPCISTTMTIIRIARLARFWACWTCEHCEEA